MFDVKQLKQNPPDPGRYKRQLDRIAQKNSYIQNVQIAVEDAIRNVRRKCRSFVTYGEPQSGKTEMMIALTARLLDEGFRIVIVLLNDSVQLLNQNLERFRRSGIDPAPKNFSEIMDPVVEIGDSEWILFSKKNSKDLGKLIQKIGPASAKVIIDDEADYASPNSKINKGEKTRINALIEQLIGDDGVYIGVTATPARLDLNNTFRNENESWVDFPPHPLYTGQNTFFPTSIDKGGLQFVLTLLPDMDDAPRYLRDALFGFFVNVAHLNLTLKNGEEKNYSILVHTSGKRADHTADYKEVVKTFNILNGGEDSEKYYSRIHEIAKSKYPGEEDDITKYVFDNRNRHTVVVMNSDTDKNVVDYRSATVPATLFTVVIGGNIVSRGVTFENLLSMFFTRDVKHKIQQDTYIQRARMFGSRGQYLRSFDLHIPEKLYLDWHRCFVFHRLSLESIRSGNGSPVWLEDTRVSAVASSSIDKTTVSFNSGEMSFEIFDYDAGIEKIIDGSGSNLAKLKTLARTVGKNSLPDYVLEYVEHFDPNGDRSIAIHKPRPITGSKKGTNQERIERVKGFIGGADLKRFPDAIHHFVVLYNNASKARVFYKYEGMIKFIRNLRPEND